jgi:hypothetical protein
MRRVYFIKPVGADGPIKIGCTSYGAERLDALMRWSPVDLEMIASVEGDFVLEARIHRMLADTHIRHEWFAPSATLDALIASVLDGTFQADALPTDKRPLWYDRYCERRWPDKAKAKAAA